MYTIPEWAQKWQFTFEKSASTSHENLHGAHLCQHGFDFVSSRTWCFIDKKWAFFSCNKKEIGSMNKWSWHKRLLTTWLSKERSQMSHLCADSGDGDSRVSAAEVDADTPEPLPEAILLQYNFTNVLAFVYILKTATRILFIRLSVKLVLWLLIVHYRSWKIRARFWCRRMTSHYSCKSSPFMKISTILIINKNINCWKLSPIIAIDRATSLLL